MRLTGQGNVWDQVTTSFWKTISICANFRWRDWDLAVSLIAAFLVWYWSSEGCGENPALLATILFATTPVVLGHAGQATTDIAITATLTGTLEEIRSGGNSPIPFDELMEVSEATFAVEEEIGSGTRI